MSSRKRSWSAVVDDDAVDADDTDALDILRASARADETVSVAALARCVE